jgi:hypothetical protein
LSIEMTDPIKTLREALQSVVGADDWRKIEAGLAAITLLEQAMREPKHWRAVLDPEQVPQQLKTALHVVGFRDKKAAEGFVIEQLDFYGWRYTIEPLFAVPPAQQATPCKLGCTITCKAKEHGCASECPALPWQPAQQAQHHYLTADGVAEQWAPPAQQINEWREAVLDKLAEHCIDAPIDEPPATILGRIIEVAIAMHEVCKNAPAEPCEPFNAPAQQAQPTRTHAPCKGMNCGITSTDQEHSLECQAEHAAAIAGGAFMKQAQAEAVPQWIDPSDKMPEDGQECLVWSRQRWEKAFSVKMDTWQEQHEAPLSFSSATIPIGVGWDAHNFEDVIAWMPLPAAPQPKEQSK